MNTIQIYSDLICPWCYIGKRRMEEALRQMPPETQITRSWHPFQLNPGMPPSGMDRKVYRIRKFGSWERSQAMDSDVAAAGETVGIKIRYLQSTGRVFRGATTRNISGSDLPHFVGLRRSTQIVPACRFRHRR